MLITSFKSNAELYSLKSIPLWIQNGVITDHYRYLFGRTEFLTWILNSLIISRHNRLSFVSDSMPQT